MQYTAVRRNVSPLAIFLLAAFPALAVSNSVTLTEWTGRAQTNRPITISRVFAQGEIPHYARPRTAGAPLPVWQNDVKNRWPDGSLRHVLITFFFSFRGKQSASFDFVDERSRTSDGRALTTAEMLAFNKGTWNIGVELTNGDTLSANARKMLSDDIAAGKACGDAGSRCQYWMQGPAVTQAILEGPLDDPTHAFDYDMGWGEACNGAPCKPIRPRFVATFYQGHAGVQEEIVLENTWSTKLEDTTYDIAVKTGAALETTRYSKAGVLHYATGRQRKAGYWDGAASGAIKTDLNVAYMVHSRAVMNYDVAGIGHLSNHARDLLIAKWNKSDRGVDISGAGNFIKGFTQTGQTMSDQNGPTTEWQSSYLLSFDPELETVVRGNGDVSGHVAVHMREGRSGAAYCGASCTSTNLSASAFGRWMSIDARPSFRGGAYTYTWWLHWNGVAAADKVSPMKMVTNAQGKQLAPGGWNVDADHQPEFGYIPYLLFGDYFYYEELLAWSHYNLVSMNSSVGGIGRHGNWGSLVGPTQRAMAWTWRTLGNAVFLALAGSPERQYLEAKMENTARVLEGVFDIRDGNYPPRGDVGCGNGYNEATTTDMWRWGRCTSSWRAKLPNPMPVTLWLAGRAGFIDPSFQSQPEWQQNMWLISMGWNNDRGMTQASKVLEVLLKAKLKLYFDPLVNPYIMQLPLHPALKGAVPISDIATFRSAFVDGSVPPGCARFSWDATDWMCRMDIDRTELQGYAYLARAMLSFTSGLSVTVSNGATVTGADAWAWINDPARKLVNRPWSGNPKYAVVPR